MYSVTKFHTLLLSFYFLNIIYGISGNETPTPAGNSNGININKTTLLPPLSSYLGRENSQLHSGFSEGGLTESVSATKVNFSTVHTRIEEESTVANDEKKTNLTLGSALYSLEESGPISNHNHVSKPRKGVNNNDSFSEVSLIDHKTSGPVDTSVKEQKLKDSFNVTSNTSTFRNIVSKMSSEFLSSTVSSTIEISSKYNEGEKKVNLSVNEEKETNSSGIPLVPLSTAISKPKFTRIDAEDEKLSFSFSSESDYVIPIVALIFAAPLLAILGMVLYKRSKEFWERRHYRRMDFLIDGMYND